jgi:rhomboid protease GluP
MNIRSIPDGSGLAETPGSDVRVVTRFHFKRPQLLPPVVMGALAAAPVGMLIPWYRSVLSGASPWRGLVFIAVASAAFAIVVLGVRMLRRPKQGRSAELHDGYALLPKRPTSRKALRIDYEQITSLNVFGKGRWARLLVATGKRNFVYPVGKFEGGADGLAMLRQSLREGIAALPGGVERLREIDQRDATGRRILQKPPRVTTAMLALLAAIYGWTWLGGALDSPFGLVAYGANAPALVADGAWYRLLSANFLHVNLLHIYLNCTGILLLGLLLERLVGSWRFLCIYLCSAVAGAAASALMSNAAFSVGASTAVFGLLGAHAYVNWRFRASLPGGFGQPLRSWLIILGINAVLPIVVPMIDWAAHVGGLFAGALVAALLLRKRETIEPLPPAQLGVRAATSALAGACVIALIQAFGDARRDDGLLEARVARAFVEQASTGARELNGLAWHYATQPQPSVSELALAHSAALRAVALDPDNDSLIDTLATVQYRQLDFDAAVMTQRQAVRIDERNVLVSQMGRFLDARVAARGPVALGNVDADGIAVGVERTGTFNGGNVEGNEWTIVVDLPHATANGLEVYVLDKRGGNLLGTLRILIGPGTSAGQHRFALVADRTPTRWPQGTDSLVVAYADATGCACPPSTISGRYFFMSRAVWELPDAR